MFFEKKIQGNPLVYCPGEKEKYFKNEQYLFYWLSLDKKHCLGLIFTIGFNYYME